MTTTNRVVGLEPTGPAGLTMKDLATLPSPSELPPMAGFPDPLRMLDGSAVQDKQDWVSRRRPELLRLFQEYEYGVMPPPPADMQWLVVYKNDAALGGKATIREFLVRCSRPTLEFRLLLVTPNFFNDVLPCLLGLNFAGNHAVIDDPGIALTTAWILEGYSEERGQATWQDRGRESDAWDLVQCVERGYCVATVFYGEIVPDRVDLAEARLTAVIGELDPSRAGTVRAGNDVGGLALRAWALSRAFDVLAQEPRISSSRIGVFGHSRNGMAAMIAGVFDERMALIIPHHAGNGATAPCRLPAQSTVPGPDGKPPVETVEFASRTFPHWWCPNFQYFGEHVDQLPFDQHSFISLCVPRPILVPTATEDLWANPSGQFEMIKAADPVYKLVTGEGLYQQVTPTVGQVLKSRLGYFIREGKHRVTKEDWTAWLDYADVWL
jgi:(4-O-methyl)-D-glucuronate---lignin esterase